MLWIFQEIAATRLRRAHVDLHAASVEHRGRALLIAGPKGAGKTTLSFHLMRSHRCHLIANDRSFAGCEAAAPAVSGMPTVIRIRPPTLARFPELRNGVPPVARPYLYNLAELDTASRSEESPDAVDFMLAPNQLAARLGAGTRAAAPLGAIVFPQVCSEEATWALEPLAAEDVVAGIYANLYGAANGERPATSFEELGGGQHHPSRRLVTAIAAGVAGYRLRLGHNAYADATLGERLLRLLESR